MSEEIYARLRDRFQDALQGTSDFRGDQTLLVKTAALPRVAQALRDEFDFAMLVDLCGVDYHPREPRFEVVYHFLSLVHNARLRLKVGVPEGKTVPTLSGLYPMANWAEREVYDLVGVSFEGHPDLRRIFMPEDWMGHPLQRVHPLGYEEVQFTHNFASIDQIKPYAKK